MFISRSIPLFLVFFKLMYIHHIKQCFIIFLYMYVMYFDHIHLPASLLSPLPLLLVFFFLNRSPKFQISKSNVHCLFTEFFPGCCWSQVMCTPTREMQWSMNPLGNDASVLASHADSIPFCSIFGEM